MPDIRGAVALSTNYQLDKAKHGSPDLHKIGQALLDPTYVAPVASTTTGAVGQSDEVCRADHVHGLSQTTLDAITAAGNSGANGNAVYNQINTPVDFSYYNPLRFTSAPATMGSGANQFFYIRQGPMVDVFATWSVANNSAYPAGILQVWLPVGLNNVSAMVPCGFLRIEDAGIGQHQYYAIAVDGGAGHTVFQFINAAHNAFATNGSPNTWTLNDAGRGWWRYYGT